MRHPVDQFVLQPPSAALSAQCFDQVKRVERRGRAGEDDGGDEEDDGDNDTGFCYCSFCRLVGVGMVLAVLGVTAARQVHDSPNHSVNPLNPSSLSP